MEFKLNNSQTYLFYKKITTQKNLRRSQFLRKNNREHLKIQKNKELKRPKNNLFYNAKKTMVFSKSNRFIHKTVKKPKLMTTRPYKVISRNRYYTKRFVTTKTVVSTSTHGKQHPSKRFRFNVNTKMYRVPKQNQWVKKPSSGDSSLKSSQTKPERKRSNRIIHSLYNKNKKLATCEGWTKRDDLFNVSVNNGNAKRFSSDLYKKISVTNTIYYHNSFNGDDITKNRNNLKKNHHVTTNVTTLKKHKLDNNHFDSKHNRKKPNSENEGDKNPANNKETSSVYSLEHFEDSNDKDSGTEDLSVSTTNEKNSVLSSQVMEKLRINHENKYVIHNEHKQDEYDLLKGEEIDKLHMNKDKEVSNQKINTPVKSKENLDKIYSRSCEVITEDGNTGYQHNNINVLTTTSRKSLFSKLLNFFGKKMSSKRYTTMPTSKKDNYRKSESCDYSEEKRSEERHYSQNSDAVTTRKSLIRKFLDIIHKETMPRGDEGSGGRVGDIFEELVHRGSKAIRKAIQQNIDRDSVTNDNSVGINSHKESHTHIYGSNSYYDGNGAYRNGKIDKHYYSTSGEAGDFYDSGNRKVRSSEPDNSDILISKYSRVKESENGRDNYYNNSSNNRVHKNKETEINEFSLPIVTELEVTTKGASNDLSVIIENSDMVRKKQLNLTIHKVNVDQSSDDSISVNDSLGSNLNNLLIKETKERRENGTYRRVCRQTKGQVPTRIDINTSVPEEKDCFDYLLLINTSSNIFDSPMFEKMTLENNVSYALKPLDTVSKENTENNINNAKNESVYEEGSSSLCVTNVNSTYKTKTFAYTETTQHVTDKSYKMFTLII